MFIPKKWTKRHAPSATTQLLQADLARAFLGEAEKAPEAPTAAADGWVAMGTWLRSQDLENLRVQAGLRAIATKKLNIFSCWFAEYPHFSLNHLNRYDSYMHHLYLFVIFANLSMILNHTVLA